MDPGEAAGGEAVGPAAEDERTVVHGGSTRVGVRRHERQRRGPGLHQALRPREDRAHHAGLRHKSRAARRKGSVSNRAAREGDCPERGLAVAAQIQHPASRGEEAAGQ